MTKKIKNRPGFTLLEMIVATAIFVIVSTICIGIYILTMKANTQVISMQKIQNEMRFAMDYISREVRLGTIYYDYYENSEIQNPVDVLALEDNFSNRVFFRRVERENEDGEINGFLQVQYNNSNWSDITGNNVNVEDLYFYIDPITSDVKNQNIVTIVMRFFDDRDESEILLQTTISARNYIK